MCYNSRQHALQDMHDVPCYCRLTDNTLWRSMQVYDTELSLMVPQADLANHAFQPNAVYALKASQGIFELRSCSPIAAGQPICITYGTEKTNFELMRDYGFIVPGNPNDRLDFSCTTLQQRPTVVAKPAQMLFKMLNAGECLV